MFQRALGIDCVDHDCDCDWLENISVDSLFFEFSFCLSQLGGRLQTAHGSLDVQCQMSQAVGQGKAIVFVAQCILYR